MCLREDPPTAPEEPVRLCAVHRGHFRRGPEYRGVSKECRGTPGGANIFDRLLRNVQQSLRSAPRRIRNSPWTPLPRQGRHSQHPGHPGGIPQWNTVLPTPPLRPLQWTVLLGLGHSQGAVQARGPPTGRCHLAGQGSGRADQLRVA